MKQPTYYYIEYNGFPPAIFWEVPFKWAEFIKTLNHQLVKTLGVDNIISVIQQVYEKHCAPAEKENLILKQCDDSGTYIFKIFNWEVLTLKEAYL